MNTILRIFYFCRFFFIFAYIYIVYAQIVHITEKYLHRTVASDKKQFVSTVMYMLFFIFVGCDMYNYNIEALVAYPLIMNIIVLLCSVRYYKYEKKSSYTLMFSSNSRFIAGFIIANSLIYSSVELLGMFIEIPSSLEDLTVMLTVSTLPFLIAFCIEAILLRTIYNTYCEFSVQHSLLMSCFYFIALMVCDVQHLFFENKLALFIIFPLLGVITNIILAVLFDLRKRGSSFFSTHILFIYFNI